MSVENQLQKIADSGFLISNIFQQPEGWKVYLRHPERPGGMGKGLDLESALQDAYVEGLTAAPYARAAAPISAPSKPLGWVPEGVGVEDLL